MVERHLAKVDVAGSSPVFRSNMRVSYIGNTPAFQAGKVGSIPTTRSIKLKKKTWHKNKNALKLKAFFSE